MHFFIPFFFILCLSSPSYSLDIVKTLAAHQDFNIISSLLQASGVRDYLEVKQNDNGFMLFVPHDQAFADLPRSVALQSLPSDQKIILLKGHVLPFSYPLNVLLGMTAPDQVTLASDVIASTFTLNISSVNGTVYLGTGVVEVVITKTVLDERPISIFGISKVLLPKEFYGKKPRVFRSPPPPPSPPMVDSKEGDGEDADTTMLLAVLLSLDFILAVLVIYSFGIFARR